MTLRQSSLAALVALALAGGLGVALARLRRRVNVDVWARLGLGRRIDVNVAVPKAADRPSQKEPAQDEKRDQHNEADQQTHEVDGGGAGTIAGGPIAHRVRRPPVLPASTRPTVVLVPALVALTPSMQSLLASRLPFAQPSSFTWRQLPPAPTPNIPAPDRAQWGTEIAGKVKAWAKALTGPTSLPGKYPQLMNPPGSETGPGQLVTWGKSTVCSVDAFGYKFQWTTNSSKHIPFDWAGP